MPKLRDVSGKQLVRVFESFDFMIVGQKGSHIKMSRVCSNIVQTLVIPNHASIAKGTLKTIYAQASEYIIEKELRKFFYS